MLKKIFLVSASIFLVFQSYNLVQSVSVLESKGWLVVIFIAWLLNLFVTGIFAFAGFALPTQKLMPASYYKVTNPKRLKKVYRLLRVDIFRKFLLATLWRSKKQQKTYFDGTKNGIDNLKVQSIKSDFGHLIPFILINIISVYLIFTNAPKIGICSIIINFIGNFYPIILQRHHRMRIQILCKIQERRNK